MTRERRTAAWEAMRQHLWTLQPYQRDALERLQNVSTHDVTQRYRLTGFDLGCEPVRGGIIQLRGEAMHKARPLGAEQSNSGEKQCNTY